MIHEIGLGFDLWTWEALEINLGIICACVPTIKPLIIRIFPSIGSVGTSHPKTDNSHAMHYMARGTQSRTSPGCFNPFDGNKSHAMGTFTTATTTTKTTKTKMKSTTRSNDSEEHLTTEQNGILQVTSFESTSHPMTDSEMDLANTGRMV